MSAFTSCNPANGDVLFTRPTWPPEKLLSCFQRVRQQHPVWANSETALRAQHLLNLADRLHHHRHTLAAYVTQEVGRRTAECLAEIDKSILLIRYYADLAPRLLAQQTIATSASRSAVAFEPLGIVLAVMPWNYPVWQVLRFAIPALMAGNACVVKPAPSVPQTTALLEQAIAEANLSDYLQVAWIDHEQVEQAIALSDAVAFTGSTQTGRHIASLAGKHLKKSVLELGGSNPLIVLADADLTLAAQEACHSRFRDAGQSCNAAKRIILVPEIAEAFMAMFLPLVAELRCGPPSEELTTLAPLARADLREKLHAQVLDAVQHGAQCKIGGVMPEGSGFFYPATVLDYVTPQCRVYHEETFGPVASVIRAHDEADAIRIANDTTFGLGASIFTANEAHGWRLGQALNVGSVFINRYTSSDLRLPFGGVKASGYGRELSEFGLYEFVNVKTYWQR